MSEAPRTTLTELLVCAAGMFVPRPAAWRAPSTDARLIRLGARFQQLDATLSAEEHDSSISDDQLEAASEKWWQIVDQATELSARTVEGLRVKAAMLAAFASHTFDLTDGPRDRLALSLARDIWAIEGSSHEIGKGRMAGLVHRPERP